MRKVLAAVAVIALLGLFGAGQAEASTYDGTVVLTCTDLTAAGTGASILDRDNTGVGQEALTIEVTDGAGTVLYTLDFQNSLGTYSAGLINTTAYATAPAVNPLRFTLTSHAGNGLPEQVDVDVTGSCDSIPWVAPDATAPATATQGTTISVDGSGCPAGTVTAELRSDISDVTPLVSGTTTVTGPTDPFSIDLLVPADAPVGDAVISVFCGPAGEPASESTVLALTIASVPPTSAPPTTAPPTTTAPPAATTVVQTTAAFTG